MIARPVVPLFILLAAVLASCGSSRALVAPGSDPYVIGPIESISHGAAASGLLVQAGPGSIEMCGIAATVDSRTRYLRRSEGDDLMPSALAELEVGDTVAVHVTGPVAESCPVQGYASTIVLIDD
ncbi:MAG: hypothetical protein WD737_06210 [Gemmatimonadota bacterium]